MDVGTGAAVPDTPLACMDGSGDVRLAGFARPAVVSLWASWCAPCRAELPGVEAFARAATGRVDVIGVDAGDTRTAATAMISDLGLTFPMLSDPDQRLGHRLGRAVLPLTLLVAPGGRIAATYAGTALTEASLATWVDRYLGVPVADGGSGT